MNPCPKCGCPELVKAGRVKAWGEILQRFQCAHCSHRFTQSENGTGREELESVPFVSICCPHCGSTSTLVTKTIKPTRYHVCRGCHRTFRSEE